MAPKVEPDPTRAAALKVEEGEAAEPDSEPLEPELEPEEEPEPDPELPVAEARGVEVRPADWKLEEAWMPLRPAGKEVGFALTEGEGAEPAPELEPDPELELAPEAPEEEPEELAEPEPEEPEPEPTESLLERPVEEEAAAVLELELEAELEEELEQDRSN